MTASARWSAQLPGVRGPLRPVAHRPSLTPPAVRWGSRRPDPRSRVVEQRSGSTMTATVIGCVWGAHRALVDQLGDDAPSYEWCEQQWRTRLARLSPGPTVVPDWLRIELWSLWRAQAAVQRAEGLRRGVIAGDAHQLSLSLWGAA